MKLQSDYEVLVIAGGWNKYILTSAWVANLLMLNVDLQEEFPLNFNGSLRISSDEIRLFIIENKLNFTAIKTDEMILKKIQEYSLKMADYLPHTPVNSFGINFLFKTEINTELKKLFTLQDGALFDGVLTSKENINITRSYKFADYTLNLALSNIEETCTISFNYHFEIKDLVDFKGKIDQHGILKLKNDSIEILKRHYNLELEIDE